jgi:serine/threonine protein phosphatase 1
MGDASKLSPIQKGGSTILCRKTPSSPCRQTLASHYFALTHPEHCSMPIRTIAIGDIHGCALEFEELLQLLAPTPTDRIILLGDLINRGPNSLRVLEIARRCGAISLLGNHERRLREYRRTRDLSLLKKEDYDALAQLRTIDWDYLEAMVLTHYESDIDTVFVHGGFLPDQPWQEQSADIVTRIQVVDKQGLPQKRTDGIGCPSWADLWKGPPRVVYGHTPRRSIYRTPWTIGIDTGCVLGGRLTACILPECKFVQVRAHKAYYVT